MTIQHDEFCIKPVLDKNRHLIPREDYRISVLNCDGEDFALSCIRANRKYKKNSQRKDVKSHHYIISFDPRDVKDNGLTPDKAQELGLSFCKKHFPGHQAIVCTHPNGHNHSGNIHVHIVINSLRIADVERKPYMDRPCDNRAGAKHRCTATLMRYLRKEVMEMCHQAGLHQIDLLNGSKEKVTDHEYWAKKRGQRELNEKNAKIIADGLTPRKTNFETEKDRLRCSIRSAATSATSFEKFAEILMRDYGIVVKENRGRYSYLTPGRTKPITARRLGTDFDKDAILYAIASNVNYYNLDELEIALQQAASNQRNTSQRIKALEKQIADNKELIRQVDVYRRTKPVYDVLRTIKHPKRIDAYRERNRTELALFASAKRYLTEKGFTQIPDIRKLQEENKALISQKNILISERNEQKMQVAEMRRVKDNFQVMLYGKRQIQNTTEIEL